MPTNCFSFTFLADLLVGSEVRLVVNQRVVQSFLSYHCCPIHLCYHHYYAAQTAANDRARRTSFPLTGVLSFFFFNLEL